jgi:hypothetical protein
MKLTLVALALSVLVGLLAGGRISNLASSRIRWPFLAPAGLALQLLPVPGRVLPMALLFVSFALLLTFALANIRTVGFALIVAGLALNFAVIAIDGGMPITRHALVASGQSDTLSLLVHHGGAKHHLASASDRLLPLADVIPVRGIDQAVSAGDVVTYLGVMLVVVAWMRRRDEEKWVPETGRAAIDLETADVRR